MSYKLKTKYFGLPVPAHKEKLNSDVEMQKWQIVENMIVASMRGNLNSIFQEGDLRIKNNVDGTYSVTMSATGASPCLQGAVGGAFFDVNSFIEWKDLNIGKNYFLYIKGSNKTFLSPSSVTAVSSTYRMKSNNVVLVAKADLTGETLVVDRNPAGKVNSRDLIQHVLDSVDPHGETLSQSGLIVRDKLVVGNGNNPSIRFDVFGDVKEYNASDIVESLSSKTTFVDFTTKKDGVVMTAKGRVLFASVVQTSPGDVGKVVVGFYGVDANVKQSNQLVVTTTGETDIGMRAMITYEV